MFSTLENSWDHSARRGWSALASFTFQALALSLLLAIPMFVVQGPPRLQWLQPVFAPALSTPTPVPANSQHYSGDTVVSVLNNPLIAPRYIPKSTPRLDNGDGVLPPDPRTVPFGQGGGGAVPYGLGTAIPAVAPKPPAPTHPVKVSHWAEGNLIYRVQPAYPPLARQARIQGTVLLRAIIGKTGTIEHLTLESGHPMLAGSAIEAVRQWRYRPYRLNDEPIEIETEITVNFVLAAM
jgi:protein TonB